MGLEFKKCYYKLQNEHRIFIILHVLYCSCQHPTHLSDLKERMHFSPIRGVTIDNGPPPVSFMFINVVEILTGLAIFASSGLKCAKA